MPGDKPLTPEERLEALKFGRVSKLKNEIRARRKSEEQKEKEVEKSVFDRLVDIFSGRSNLFGGQDLDKASKAGQGRQ